MTNAKGSVASTSIMLHAYAVPAFGEFLTCKRTRYSVDPKAAISANCKIHWFADLSTDHVPMNEFALGSDCGGIDSTTRKPGAGSTMIRPAYPCTLSLEGRNGMIVLPGKTSSTTHCSAF